MDRFFRSTGLLQLVTFWLCAGGRSLKLLDGTMELGAGFRVKQPAQRRYIQYKSNKVVIKLMMLTLCLTLAQMKRDSWTRGPTKHENHETRLGASFGPTDTDQVHLYYINALLFRQVGQWHELSSLVASLFAYSLRTALMTGWCPLSMMLRNQRTSFLHKWRKLSKKNLDGHPRK